MYADLQEENESYEVLLGERTLSGEMGVLFRQSWGIGGGGSDAGGSSFGGGLESVGEEGPDEEEEEEEQGEEQVEDEVERILLESRGIGSERSGAVQAATSAGWAKKRNHGNGQGTTATGRKRRDSEAMDLAAELEAAQMADEEDEFNGRREKREGGKYEGEFQGFSFFSSFFGGGVGKLMMVSKFVRFGQRDQTSSRSQQSVDALRLQDCRPRVQSRRV